MKVRLGFVTNSSSSSFLIKQIGGKPGNIDELYLEVKKLYQNMLNTIDQAVEFAVQWGIIKPGQGVKELIARADKELCSPKTSEQYENFEKAFETKFEFNVFEIDIHRYDLSWMKHETYTEYLASFKSMNDAPFIILDHAEVEDGTKEFNLVIEAVAWYNYDELHKHNGEDEVSYNNNVKSIAMQMGEYGVYSDCGQIPELVVMDLCDTCDFSCNHMG